MGKTLAEKIWDDHIVRSAEGEPDLLYIDLHLIHEVTSPQAFDGLRLAGRPVRRTDLTIATEDHNTPTLDILKPIADPVSKLQIDTLRSNAKEFGIRLHSLGDADQGVVHVVGPQLGITQPGMTIVCGDSHTSTHGAFGAIAFGIGTSEVEHVLATQTLPSRRPKTMAINVEGTLKTGVSAKDIILAEDFEGAEKYWRSLFSDADAKFDVEITISADELEPFVTWGTNPGQGLPLNASVPNPAEIKDAEERGAAERALQYMGLVAGTPLKKIAIDTVFLGSCTNGRIEDLRAAASVLEGKKIATTLRMLVVPGSERVRQQAMQEGLDKVFIDAGAEWRNAGCSMCLGMNPDQLAVGERSASTSNRNFEGRQGKGGRTHLVSPLVAAATAIRGTLSSPADL